MAQVSASDSADDAYIGYGPFGGQYAQVSKYAKKEENDTVDDDASEEVGHQYAQISVSQGTREEAQEIASDVGFVEWVAAAQV